MLNKSITLWVAAFTLMALAPHWAQAQAQAPQTCADLQWGSGLAGNMETINSPGPTVPTKVDSLQVKSDAAKKKAYLASVFPGKFGAHGNNTPTSVGRNEQAEGWCELRAKDQDPEDVKLPPKLPTLGEGVQALHPRAIALSWQVLQALPVQQLKESCASAVARFVKTGGG